MFVLSQEHVAWVSGLLRWGGLSYVGALLRDTGLTETFKQYVVYSDAS